MATTDTQYEQLSARVDHIWAEHNVTITYTYDDNGAMTQKDVTGGSDQHVVDYEYNLQGRLAKVTETRGANSTVTTFVYNSNGIRIAKTVVDGAVIT